MLGTSSSPSASVVRSSPPTTQTARERPLLEHAPQSPRRREFLRGCTSAGPTDRTRSTSYAGSSARPSPMNTSSKNAAIHPSRITHARMRKRTSPQAGARGRSADRVCPPTRAQRRPFPPSVSALRKRCELHAVRKLPWFGRVRWRGVQPRRAHTASGSCAGAGVRARSWSANRYAWPVRNSVNSTANRRRATATIALRGPRR